MPCAPSCLIACIADCKRRTGLLMSACLAVRSMHRLQRPSPLIFSRALAVKVPPPLWPACLTSASSPAASNTCDDDRPQRGIAQGSCQDLRRGHPLLRRVGAQSRLSALCGADFPFGAGRKPAPPRPESKTARTTAQHSHLLEIAPSTGADTGNGTLSLALKSAPPNEQRGDKPFHGRSTLRYFATF